MRHSLIRVVLVVTCVTGSAFPALAQAPVFGTGLEVADYKTFAYLIEEMSDDAAKIGLNENRLRTRLELRLRQAGLVPIPAESGIPGYLYLQVNVVGNAHNIHLGFIRKVSFQSAGREYVLFDAEVWQRGSTGTHGSNPEFIVGGLDQLLDQFLNEYLKVNQG